MRCLLVVERMVVVGPLFYWMIPNGKIDIFLAHRERGPFSTQRQGKSVETSTK